MTVKQKVGWKVLTYNRQSSAATFRASRHYKERKKTIPAAGCGPLCVFTNEYGAHSWALNWRDLIVVRCLYKPSKFVEIWSGLKRYPLCTLPSYTALADSVTCLE